LNIQRLVEEYGGKWKEISDFLESLKRPASLRELFKICEKCLPGVLPLRLKGDALGKDHSMYKKG
jgi:hypothetical protein